MADNNVLLDKIQQSVDLQKRCARKSSRLADELEKTMKKSYVPKVAAGGLMSIGGTAMIVGGVLTAVTAGAALPVLAAAAAISGAGAPVLLSGASLLTTIGSKSTVTRKSKKTKQIVEELQELVKEIQDLIELLEPGAEEGQPSASCDDDDANIMEQLLRSEAKQQGLDLSPLVNLRRMWGLPEANFSWKTVVNKAQLAEFKKLLQQILLLIGKKEGKNIGESVGKKEASKTLREYAKALWNRTEEIEDMLKKIRKAVYELDLTGDYKKELIKHAIRKSPNGAVKEWLRENKESEIFFKLIDLCSFIRGQLEEEEMKKEKEIKRKKKKKIDLIFVAHGEITGKIIPARCLWPLRSIIDVILYSPWNCFLTADAAYAIATGRIEPRHRKFICADPKKCTRAISHHQPFPQLHNWNFMRGSIKNDVPEILVSPVGEPEDDAFPAFLLLEETFGEPRAGRYVIPYLDTDTDTVPFHLITLALALVLDSSKYEATVHLAACLGKTSVETILNKTDLEQQYCYTEDRTAMSVTSDVIYERNVQLQNMMKAVFG